MKKLLIFIITIISVQLIFSQNKDYKTYNDTVKYEYVKLTVRSAPSLTIEFNGHYDFGIYELSANNNGDFSSSQFISGENFGVRYGFGATAAVKISINKKGHLRIFLNGSYNRFNSLYSKYLVDQIEHGYAIYNVYTFGAGIENNFTPGFRFKPHVGFGITGSIIKGKARVHDENVEKYTNIDIIPAFRLGLTLYSGIEYLINNRFGLNCGIKIVHANLWLKNTKSSDNPNEIYLNDARVVPRIPYSGFRQFIWGALYIGVNMYFGVEQKNYYFKKYTTFGNNQRIYF